MKKFVSLGLLVALTGFISCGGGGGGGGGPTPTPTSTETKVATQAAFNATLDTSIKALFDSLHKFESAAIIVDEKAATTKTIDISETENCSGGGTGTVTGSATASCTITGTDFSCTGVSSTMVVAFNNCIESEDFSGKTYSETVNGSANASLTGSLSGTTASGPTNVDATIVLTGSPTLTGDISGTADLDITAKASGNPETLTPSCSGTCSVTIGSTVQVCGVSSDCSGCSE